MSYPQPHLAQWRKPHYTTGNMQQFMLAKVIKFYPDSNSADISLLRGGTMYRALIAAPHAGSDYGLLNMPQPDNLFPGLSTAGGTVDSPVGSGGRNIYAIVVFGEGMSSQPIIMGFMPPAVTSMSFTQDVRVDRHANGSYSLEHQNPLDYPPEERIYKQVVFPDNTFFSLGGLQAPLDPSTINFDKVWKTPGHDVRKLVMQHGNSLSSLTLEQDGTATIKHPLSGLVLTLNPAGDLHISGAKSVKIDGVQTDVTISAARNVSITATTISLNGSVVVNGAALQVP